MKKMEYAKFYLEIRDGEGLIEILNISHPKILAYNNFHL